MDVLNQPKISETFGSEVNQILPPQDFGIFSYRIDVLNGNWMLWKDAPFPKTSENEVINLQYLISACYLQFCYDGNSLLLS